MLSRFHLILERFRWTDGRTDGQTDRRTYLRYQYRASICWRAIKNSSVLIRFLYNFSIVICHLFSLTSKFRDYLCVLMICSVFVLQRDWSVWYLPVLFITACVYTCCSCWQPYLMSDVNINYLNNNKFYQTCLYVCVCSTDVSCSVEWIAI